MSNSQAIETDRLKEAIPVVEESLRESEERFRQVAAMTGEWLWEQDSSGRYTYSSSAVKDILGYEPEEIIGKNFFELLTPDQSKHMAEHLKNIADTKHHFFRLINLYQHKDGREVITESTGKPLFGNNGELVKWRGVDRDITAQKRFEDALRLRDRAIEAASVGIVISDASQPHYPNIYVNPAFSEMTGYSREELIGCNLSILQGANTDPAAIKEIRQSLHEARRCEVVLKNYRKDGTPFWNELLLSPVHDEKGKLTHFIGVQNDVTKLRQADDERHELEIAKEIQQSLLPSAPLKVSGVLVAGYCFPTLHVGGDYFDYFCVRECVDVVIADVSGHSVGAALIMAETRSTLKAETRNVLKSRANLTFSASDILHDLNDLLYEDLSRADVFITMFYMKYNVADQELSFANAGHNCPLLLRHGQNKCKQLDAEGLVLGVNKQVSFEEKKIRLSKGDMLLLYTDGITEAQNKVGEFFGTNRLCALFASHSEETPQGIIDSVIKDLEEFCDTSAFEDDISMVIMKLV